MATLIGIPTGSPNLSKALKKNGLVWKLDRSFTREYLILADTIDEPQESLLAVVPTLGAVGIGGCRCKSVKVQETNTVTHPKTGKLTALVKITCEYDNDVRLDPLELLPTVRWSCETVEESMEVDVNGAKIQTKNGEYLECTQPVSIPVLEISRFQKMPWNPNINFTHANHLNEATFWGAPPKHALLDPVSCDYVQIELTSELKTWFAKVSYRIRFRYKENCEEPWKFRPLHFGNLEKKEGVIVQAKDAEGRPIQVNLDSEGYRLPDSAEAPVFLEFDRYNTADFSRLGINNTDLGF